MQAERSSLSTQKKGKKEEKKEEKKRKEGGESKNLLRPFERSWRFHACLGTTLSREETLR